jgi:acetyl-CoA carboxylase carboxyl transferase beta subunit/acetyl-CoA carboxylase carboxyl transferase alpha subunit
MIESTQVLVTVSKSTSSGFDRSTDSGLLKDILVKCARCRALLYVRDWERNFKICHECGYHFRLSAAERIASLLDAESFVEADIQMRSGDPLHFISQSHTYPEKLVEEQKRTGLNEAVIIGTGRVAGHALALAVMDFHFIGGSMGSVVGEKVTRAIELAREKCIPLLIVSASGGARMHEGILSLMQMAKTSVALAHLSEAGLPFISLLTDPTTGGVTASFAMLGDIILAEPGALVGFAGPRVIEQFTHQKLPEDANTSEFMLEHGMIDVIVPRPLLRSTIACLLDSYSVQLQGDSESKPFLGKREQKRTIPLHQQISSCLQSNAQMQPLEIELQPEEKQLLLSPWDQVQLARHKDRPHTTDYIRLMCKGFFELRGDRRYGDDPAIIGGLATFADRTIMMVGHQKGRDARQRQACNSGMSHPEGYRKAQRLMRHAEKFGFPVVCLIDTPGAFPGIEAEQRGQAQAIAESLALMTTLRVPIVAVVIGEGGSGGALALGLADRVLMLEHSIYTVASPEAAASILWRDNTRAAQAAEAMRITALDLLKLGVIDGIIPEPAGGAHLDHSTSGQFLAEHLHKILTELVMTPMRDLLEQRHTKFRNFGHFSLV